MDCTLPESQSIVIAPKTPKLHPHTPAGAQTCLVLPTSLTTFISVSMLQSHPAPPWTQLCHLCWAMSLLAVPSMPSMSFYGPGRMYLILNIFLILSKGNMEWDHLANTFNHVILLQAKLFQENKSITLFAIFQYIKLQDSGQSLSHF